MKLSKAWRELKRDQRRAWMVWAKNNRVLLPDGNVRRVSGHKAMSVVLANRALAGEAANPTVVPAAVTWLDGALSVRDAGPFTENAGFVGFRAEQNIAGGTKWFVWATEPARESLPAPALRRDEVGKRISAVELREGYAIEERREMKRSLATMAETQATLARTVDRVSILFEQQGNETKADSRK